YNHWYTLWKEGSCFFPLNSQYRISNIRYNVSSGERYPVPDKSAPVYITVEDGGNQESLAGRSKIGHMHSTIRTAMMMGKKWQLTRLYYTISTVEQSEMKKTKEALFE
ncbi:hypothetical protein ERO13_D08G076466v2, partial [Gossypium hirsutum]